MSIGDPFRLDGKLALVTGGTRGIGRAISLRFARAGARVIAGYVRDDSSAAELSRLAEEEHIAVETCQADLTIPKGIEKVSATVRSSGRPLDVLVHCAATGVHKPVEELTGRHFEWVFALNVKAFAELVRALLPCFSAGACIVAVSSRGAARAVPYYSLVGATKGALEAYARHLAVELAPRGMRVNILSPGSVRTDAWKVLPEAEARLEETLRRTPTGRLVTPDEVAWAAQFLCSEASSGIVGHTLVVDGGNAVVE